MSLYEMYPRKTILRANLRSGVCSSQELFASCDIDGSNTQNTRLNALIPNIAEGRSRAFGCNVTALIFEGFVETYSWTYNIRHISEYSTHSWTLSVRRISEYITCSWTLSVRRFSEYITYSWTFNVRHISEYLASVI